MKATITCTLACGGAAAFTPAAVPKRADVRMESLAELKNIAVKLNPAVGYWDPLKLSEQEFWDNTNEESIGWLRHAEIKHGRIAMAGFVGYCVQANGIKFPWEPFASITATSPPDQWDALPEAAKIQIILGIGFLEWWSELRLVEGEAHYMKGGKPGYVPAFDATPEQKEAKLLTEVNNGRLAMIGLFGLLSEAKVPGSVPLLKGVIPFYSGEVMAPLAYSGPTFAEVHA